MRRSLWDTPDPRTMKFSDLCVRPGTDADVAKEASADVPIAPDLKGKPWEMYQACGEAARLVPLCVKAAIKPKEPNR